MSHGGSGFIIQNNSILIKKQPIKGLFLIRKFCINHLFIIRHPIFIFHLLGCTSINLVYTKTIDTTMKTIPTITWNIHLIDTTPHNHSTKVTTQPTWSKNNLNLHIVLWKQKRGGSTIHPSVTLMSSQIPINPLFSKKNTQSFECHAN